MALWGTHAGSLALVALVAFAAAHILLPWVVPFLF
jgi:hypothetical protein